MLEISNFHTAITKWTEVLNLCKNKRLRLVDSKYTGCSLDHKQFKAYLLYNAFDQPETHMISMFENVLSLANCNMFKNLYLLHINFYSNFSVNWKNFLITCFKFKNSSHIRTNTVEI